jgi:hypothetical protein
MLTPLSATASCALPTCIAVSVPATNIATGVTVDVGVFDPTYAPNDYSNALPFTVVASAPTVTAINPSSVSLPLPTVNGTVENTEGITITGTNFYEDTTVSLTQLYPLPTGCVTTTVNSTTSLTANVLTLQPTCMLYGGVFFVVANNPQPGGGSSNPNLNRKVCCQFTGSTVQPSNYNFTNATTIGTGTFTLTEGTTGATTNGPVPPCVSGTAAANGGNSKSVWFSYTPSTNTTAEADTIGSNYDTILSVWTGSPSNPVNSNVGCNNDIIPGVDLVSQITNFTMDASTTYYFMISAFNGDGGKLVFNLSSSAAPTSPSLAFTASASAVSPSSISPGSSATFTETFTPVAGSLAGPIALGACASSPSTTTITCTYNSQAAPASVQLNAYGGSATTATVTINTTANSIVAPRGTPFQLPPAPWVAAWLTVILLLGLLAWKWSPGRRPATALALALALTGLLVFQGACGGPSKGTPGKTYTIMIPTTPTSANGNVSVQITVQ